ncbi:hypothetical protein BGW38_001783 [Lunasporangiospora selenospora]|uniref:Uncharacterized protein n=1 Tax=Lunasporangiospora selenospora TaxID=979761 RepID=A0A9P6KDU4_9FUNG|nr:hypothetical protein BGW38_001783 [Lunasporangiospora selenospora]
MLADSYELQANDTWFPVEQHTLGASGSCRTKKIAEHAGIPNHEFEIPAKIVETMTDVLQGFDFETCWLELEQQIQDNDTGDVVENPLEVESQDDNDFRTVTVKLS